MKTITTITQKPWIWRVLNTAPLLFFILGMLLTVAIGQLFKGCNRNVFVHDSLPRVVTAKHPPSQLDTLLAYRKQVVGLNMKNIELERQIHDAKKAIVDSAASNNPLRKKLVRYIDKSQVTSDTALLLSNCDSLATAAMQLMIFCIERDSMYQSLTNMLSDQVQLKDSIIIVLNRQHEYLQGVYDQALSEKQGLVSDNLGLQKEVRKHKTRNRWISAGLITIGSAITYMKFHH